MAGLEGRALIGSSDGDLWLFAYGSLLWRPAIRHAERAPALLRHWGRRFWQGSTDHRGVAGAPGRVVTLVPAPGEHCWGHAYRVLAAERDAVLARLDWREKGGYERRRVVLEVPERGGVLEDVLVYVATEGNRNYLGPAPLPTIADQVVRSAGPSGSNRDYVLRLARALRDMGAEDAHVFALEALVRDAGADAAAAQEGA